MVEEIAVMYDHADYECLYTIGHELPYFWNTQSMCLQKHGKKASILYNTDNKFCTITRYIAIDYNVSNTSEYSIHTSFQIKHGYNTVKCFCIEERENKTLTCKNKSLNNIHVNK